MRKYFVIAILLSLYYLPSASQDPIQKKVQHEIDSLKNILPSLRDSARIDCLNTLAYVFDDLPYNYFITADSVYPYASQAYSEANKIGYTRGLGYANLRMAYYYYMIADNYSVLHNKYNPDHFDSMDKHIKQAILIGEKLNDKIMVGVGYDLKANLEDIKDNDKQMVTYLNQAVSQVEKWNKQSGTYKEPGYVDCPGCKGNESWLGNLYMELYRNYLHNKEYADAAAQLQKAIQLFEKIGDPYELGQGYSSLSQLQLKQRNFSAVENSAKKSLLFFQEAGDWQGELNVLNQLSKFYWDSGNFENGLEYGERSVFLTDKYFRSKSGTIPYNFEWDLFWMSSFYQYAGDYETAMEYMRRLYPYSRQSPLAYELRTLGIGETYRLMGNLDSAMHYLTFFENDTIRVGPGKTSLGYLYLDLKQYDKAIGLIKEGIEMEKKKDNIGPVARGLQAAGKAYFLKKDYNTALQYARKASAAMKSIKMNAYLIDNYKLLSEIFHEIKRDDSAYYYSRAYTNLKESLVNRQFLWKLNNIKKQAEVERRTGMLNLLNKENQLKEQKLKQQAIVKNGLIIGIILLFFSRNFHF